MRVKKAFLGAALTTLATTAPIAVAVSCGKNNSVDGISKWKSVDGISKWKTNLKVGQEYSLEQQGSTMSSLKFGLDAEMADKVMILQIFLAGYGFTLFSNVTSAFEDLTDGIPDVRHYHNLKLKKEANTLTDPDEIQKLDELEDEIKAWCAMRKKDLMDKTKNKVQGISWTSGGKDILKDFPRTYKITDIKDTNEGVAIKTTLSTQPPKGVVDGYLINDPVSGKLLGKSGDSGIKVVDAIKDIDKAWEDINKDIKFKQSPNDATLITKHVIMKKFVGIKYSNTLFNIRKKSLPKGNNPKNIVEALKALKDLNAKEKKGSFQESVKSFRELENFLNDLIMQRITKENGDITKLFEKKSYTYKPRDILKDLQTKVKTKPKYKNLLGNVKPNNLSWIK